MQHPFACNYSRAAQRSYAPSDILLARGISNIKRELISSQIEVLRKDPKLLDIRKNSGGCFMRVLRHAVPDDLVMMKSEGKRRLNHHFGD